MNSVFFILGFYPKGHKSTKSERTLIDMCLLHAQKSVALFWKKTSRPSVTYWVRQMLITDIQRGRQDLFEEVWGPFNLFVKDMELMDEET